MRFPFLVLFLLLSACSSVPATPLAPAQLPLEKLTVEPGEQLSVQIPPDHNTNPPEANPQVLLEIHVTDEAGKPIAPDGVKVDEQLYRPSADTFSVMLSGAPANPIVLRIEANGFEPWFINLPFALKHNHHFALIARLNRKPFFNEMDYE